jgi:HK97 gp10 family phage protein
MSSTGEINPRLRAQIMRTPKIALDAAAEAMEEGAKEIVEYMGGLVPQRSGELRDSIKWTWGDAPKGSLVIDEVRSGANAGSQYATLRITIYVDAWYAHFVEFGTQAHSLTKGASVLSGKRQGQGGTHPGTTAQPFFYPGWKAKKAEFNRKIKAAVQAAIREALNG